MRTPFPGRPWPAAVTLGAIEAVEVHGDPPAVVLEPGSLGLVEQCAQGNDVGGHRPPPIRRSPRRSHSSTPTSTTTPTRTQARAFTLLRRGPSRRPAGRRGVAVRAA